MHMVTIARTKDFPFWKVLKQALTYNDGNDEYIGKWKKIYANQEELVAENRDEIKKLLEENDGNLDKAVSAYMDMYRLKLGDDNVIYDRTSAKFDYCCLYGEFETEKSSPITQYENVLKQGIIIDFFVKADFSVHDAAEEECPFDDDDMVYIIDGHY